MALLVCSILYISYILTPWWNYFLHSLGYIFILLILLFVLQKCGCGGCGYVVRNPCVPECVTEGAYVNAIESEWRPENNGSVLPFHLFWDRISLLIDNVYSRPTALSPIHRLYVDLPPSWRNTSITDVFHHTLLLMASLDSNSGSYPFILPTVSFCKLMEKLFNIMCSHLCICDISWCMTSVSFRYFLFAILIPESIFLTISTSSFRVLCK